MPPPRNITGIAAFSAAGQNQSAVPSVIHFADVGVKARRIVALLLPGRNERGRFRIVEMDAAHDAKAIRILRDRLGGIVVAFAFPRRRHQHDTIDAGLVHHGVEPLVAERLRHLRLRAGVPGTFGGARLPDVNLRIDDHAPRRRLGGRRPRPLRRQRHAGARAERGAEETST